MVRPIGEFESLNEMAIINPKMCKQLSIQVEVEQRDEGPVPHVHVYLDKTRNKTGTINRLIKDLRNSIM